MISVDDQEWVRHGTVRDQGQGIERPYVMRFVTADELDKLYALHQTVVAALPNPHLFRSDSRSFMDKQIESRGRTFGVFCDDDLVGYAAISFPDGDPDNLGRDLPLPENELGNVADYDGSAVHPDYRGNDLQKLMTGMRHRWALRHDRWHILGTVSPFNAFSLRNFLALGCRVKNIKQKYGGMLRLIIHLDLRELMPPTVDPETVVDVPLTNISLQTSLLQRGYEGFRVVHDSGEPCLRYARRFGAADESCLQRAVG